MNIPYHQNSNAISYYIHPLLSILEPFWHPVGSSDGSVSVTKRSVPVSVTVSVTVSVP